MVRPPYCGRPDCGGGAGAGGRLHWRLEATLRKKSYQL